MRLSNGILVEFKPISSMRTEAGAGGGTAMPRLRLHRDEPEPDVIPFPGRTVSRIGRWEPRLIHDHPVDSIRNVEEALAQVESDFARLRDMVEHDDDDRPRAA